MSFSRRPAAGLATVGATVLAALALGGAPAMATDVVQNAGHAIMTPSPDPGDQRGNPGYGTVQQVPATPVVTTPPTVAATTPAPAGTVKATTAAPTGGPTRGRPGYSPSPSAPAPSVSESLPAGGIKSSPGTGVQSATAQPRPSVSAAGQGVSVGTTLAVTGAPLGPTLGLGGLMVAGGVAALWYTRRRRNA
ncbi:hypothetical protein [Actinoplanes sp. CA-252034]|uniref:hypothetical protein n=1 Tax=Actinoplanes sp. CA-252034 TaxID=3239906 RepID=UPI003D954B56